MEDVSELFKRHFSLLHKGTTISKSVQDRKEIHNNARKVKRDTLAFIRRNIDENQSPINTPTPRNSVTKKDQYTTETGSKVLGKNVRVSSAATVKPVGTSKRLELLQKWKADKAKQKELERARAKPIFKVCHVSSDLVTDLENANKTIKGKPIVPGSASKKSQFAPPNHKFRPPQGIKPLSFNTSVSKTQVFGFSSTSASTRLKNTPQQKAKNDLAVKKLLPENTSNSSKGSSQQQTRRPRQATSIKDDKEKYCKPDSKKNLKESVKLVLDRLNKDKEDGLIEVKKTKVTAAVGSKISKNPKVNLELKKTDTVNKSTLLRTLQGAKSNKRVANEKINNAIIPAQKTPKKVVGFNVKKNDTVKTPSNNCTNNRITYRKTPKKADNDEKDSKTNTPNSSADIVTVDSTNEESPKEDTKKSNIQVNKDGYTDSDGFIQSVPLTSNKSVGSSSSASTDYSVDYNNRDNTTPSNGSLSDRKTSPPLYISPFVTISRGKNFVRKEYQIRMSQGKGDFDKHSPEVMKILTAHTSPKAGAAYFTKKLNVEIDRITEMCNNWENYLTDSDLPEEAHSSIDVAIGQSKLLISKKFQQFRCLIAQCETENYKIKPVTCEDLHGFWDMIYMQVGDLDKRFINLQKLKDNNWEEILPQKTAPTKKPRGRPKKAQTKSKLMQMIQEARKKQKEQQSVDTPVVDILVNEAKTPIKENPQDQPHTTHRNSLRLSALTRECKSRCSSSPGLTMMKISQSIKQGDGLTPARSILKSDSSKSTGKKSVVFKDSLEKSPNSLRRTNLFNEQDKENVSDNLINFSPVSLTPRRSARISKLKL